MTALRYQALASSLLVAGFIAVFIDEDRPHAVYLTAYVILAVSLVLLGVHGRWRALLVFAIAYGVGCALWQAFWWTDDPTLSGIDDIAPLGGFIVTTPFALVLIGAGWLGVHARGRTG
jgi:hypothetical protein